MEYDYNIGGLKWDGSEWLYKYQLNNYVTLGVQPGPSAWMAWYYDCSGVDRWYIGTSAHQLVEVASTAYGFGATWNFGTNMQSMVRRARLSTSPVRRTPTAFRRTWNSQLGGDRDRERLYGSAYVPDAPGDRLGRSNPSTLPTTCPCSDPTNADTGNLAETTSTNRAPWPRHPARPEPLVQRIGGQPEWPARLWLDRQLRDEPVD